MVMARGVPPLAATSTDFLTFTAPPDTGIVWRAVPYIREGTKRLSNSQKSTESKEERKQREAKRRQEGYEWLFE
jgi:hypothetical protein